MRHCVLLLLALGCAHVRGAPVEQEGLQPGSCEDPFAKSAAAQALEKINEDRKEGYVFALHRLSNVHLEKHGENGVVFYLTVDVVETNCSVLDRNEQKTCEVRPSHDVQVYGQCKAAIFISKVNRVLRLYKYKCELRPVPSAMLVEICPDCPSLISTDDAEIKKAVSSSLEKFNKESGLIKRYALLAVNRATSSMGMATFYNAEYTIQETACTRDSAATDDCPLINCEFAHMGFCKGSLVTPPSGDTETTVECEIYEPEASDREKKLHLLGGETDHSHNDTHAHDPAHDHGHAADQSHAHDHEHDHTKTHSTHAHTHTHDDGSEHHHTHDHYTGSAHRHAHAHSHDHGHGHDHAHTHHAKAHNHTSDSPDHHHDYKHTGNDHTHEHDHELALDHDHNHRHEHVHEHHHHHHDHAHEKAHHDPEGTVKMLPAIDKPVTLPYFPEAPVVGVILPAKPDPQIPGAVEPTIVAFPTSKSSQCPPPTGELSLLDKLLTEDGLFKQS